MIILTTADSLRALQQRIAGLRKSDDPDDQVRAASLGEMFETLEGCKSHFLTWKIMSLPDPKRARH